MGSLFCTFTQFSNQRGTLPFPQIESQNTINSETENQLNIDVMITFKLQVLSLNNVVDKELKTENVSKLATMRTSLQIC